MSLDQCSSTCTVYRLAIRSKSIFSVVYKVVRSVQSLKTNKRRKKNEIRTGWLGQQAIVVKASSKYKHLLLVARY